MFMDKKGRFFGKVSIIDLLIGMGVLFLLTGLYFGRITLRSQHLTIYRVLPDPAIPGEGKPVSVVGTGLVNGCKIRLGHLAEENGRFINEAVTQVDTPEGLDPGSYTVQVRDPRGRFAQLPEGLRIRWNPRIERLEPKRCYLGAQMEIYGHYFDAHARVRLGNIPLHPLDRETCDRLPIRIEADQPIPPGTYDVTVSNPGGGSQTLRQAIEILPTPKVNRVYPDVVTYGEEVLLNIEGENLPKDATFYFNEGGRRLGDVVWVSPHWVKVPFAVGQHGMSDWYSLVLQIPGGPRMVVKSRAVCVVETVPMLFLVNLEVKEAGPEILEALQQLPESRLIELMKNDKKQGILMEPGLWFVLCGQYKLSADGKNPSFLYQGHLLNAGEEISIPLFGHTLTGRLLQPPIPVRADDEWRKVVTPGHS